MSDAEYFSIPLGSITPNDVLPFKVYLFINNHFVLYRYKNTEFEEDAYTRLQLKKVKFVFVDVAERAQYSRYVKKASKIDKATEEARKTPLGKMQQKVTKKIEKEFEKEPIEDNIENITDIATDAAKDLTDELTRRPYSTKLLGQLTSHSHGIYGHSTNVSIVALHLAMKMGYRQQHVLEYIGSAGLLHDIGKIKIDIDLLDKKKGKYTWDELNLLKQHPSIGRDLLLSAIGAPNELKLIVHQHHENHDGSGYPQGLRGTKIYEPTKILSIANTFDHIFQGAKARDQSSIKTIINVMSAPKIASKFEPRTYELALKILGDFN